MIATHAPFASSGRFSYVTMFGALLVWLSAVSVVAVSPVAVDDKVALWNCNASSERQQWDYGNGNGSPLTISVRGQTTALVWGELVARRALDIVDLELYCPAPPHPRAAI